MEKYQGFIPVRSIAKYLFCPHRYYYEYILGIPLKETIEFVKGEIVHFNVHKGKFYQNNRPVYAVNEMLESEKYGIRGRIDLIECYGHPTDKKVIPVEFRHGGGVKHLKQPYWNDQVSMGAYALLLEEQGLTVPFAEVYQAKIRRRYRIPITKTLLRHTLKTIQQIRTQGTKELPVAKFSTKCSKCGNFYFCLPYLNTSNTQKEEGNE